MPDTGKVKLPNSPAPRHASPEAIVATALASVPGFEHWAHEPAPAELTSQALALEDQALMTLVAACLLRIAEDRTNQPDARRAA